MDDYRRYGCWLICLSISSAVQASAGSTQQVSSISPATLAGQAIATESMASPITDFLTQNVPSAALQQLEQRSNDELALLQASRYRLKEDQLVAVSQRFKSALNQQRVLHNWQQALAQQVSQGQIAGLAELAQAPLFSNPLYLEMEKRLRDIDWAADDFQLYQQKLQQKTPNAQRYALVQAIVVARGELIFDINLAVSVRRQLLMTVAKVANNWTTDDGQINQMLSAYQKHQLDSRMPMQVTRLMYAYRFTVTEQLEAYLALLESDGYQAALSAWRNALDMAFVDGSTNVAKPY